MTIFHHDDRKVPMTHATRTVLLILLMLAATGSGQVSASSPGEYFSKAYEHHMQGRQRDAVKLYSKAIEANPGYIQAYQMRAAALHTIQEYNAARMDYSTVIRLGDEYFKAVAYFNRGIVNYDDGRFDLAIMDFTEAISLDHKMTDAYVYRGIARSRTGDREGQVKDFVYAARFGDKTVRSWLEEHAPETLERDR